MKRAIVIVLDSVGAGALPDAAAFGDEGANTLGHIHQKIGLKVPNMRKMGLGAIPGIGMSPADNIHGSTGRAIEVSQGKDTTTGHWEMSGLKLSQAFPTYPDGFPQEVIAAFESAIGTKVIGNKPASGTAILDELGEEHLRTGYPIVYTSGDSVFQIAAHEDVVPVQELYHICRTARRILKDEHCVGRVIARPFVGTAGNYVRTGNRRDFSVDPFGDTVLDVLKRNHMDVIGVGKIEDIFNHRGLTVSDHAAGNDACIASTLNFLKRDNWRGLMFTNLVDTDSLYGHRNDVDGFAESLEAFDSYIPEILGRLGDDGMLILTADHGVDPTFPGTDHTREEVPLMVWGLGLNEGVDLGTRLSFADVSKTLLDAFEIENNLDGPSFFPEIRA